MPNCRRLSILDLQHNPLDHPPSREMEYALIRELFYAAAPALTVLGACIVVPNFVGAAAMPKSCAIAGASAQAGTGLLSPTYRPFLNSYFVSGLRANPSSDVCGTGPLGPSVRL